MAPADKVRAGILHELKRIRVQPIRLRGPQAGPFLGRLLAPAVELQVLVVDEESFILIPTHGANSQGQFARVTNLAGGAQRATGTIEIRMIRLPQLRRADFAT